MTVGGRNRVPLARAIAQHVLPARRRASGVRPLQIRGYSQTHPEVPDVHAFPQGRLVGGASEQHSSVPSEDRHAGELPLYRLPELLEAIEGNDREIWIVADERCVDAVLALPDTGFSKDGKVPCHMPVRRLPRKTRKMRPCAAAGPKVPRDRRHRHQGPERRAGDRAGASEARLWDSALPA